ncbi:MAG: FAD-binding oxidoreductase [Chloroflexi bacterium]|nr:FAD-binding oxidoreductase [Chloroflexota bacterium]MBI1854912.1 FAD-binding oxidoreductase [Chloroflexota bacterium]MBI3341327.1 FAD-binding oxidoreductase [Chloroflexota bacterium]
MEIPTKAEIVIIGGGVMGASTAYYLAARGMKNIVLLERGEYFGQGSTGRCAGGVRYQFGTEINIRLSLASLPMLERFKDEIGQDVNYRKCGYLFVFTGEKDINEFQENLKLQNRLGVKTEWLNGDDIRKRLPLMNFKDALAGTFNREDGLADPNSVVMGYISAATRMGVKSFNNMEVIGIRVSGDKVTGVETAHGSIETRLILNAAGPWSAQVGRMAGVHIPVQPIRRQMFTTTPLPSIPPDFPFVIDFSQSLYFHREGEGLLIGMSNRNEAPGFDQSVDEDFELVNLEAAITRMPLVEQAGRASHWAGLYEVTPDSHPIFGRTPVEGFLLVTGFSGHGFMHGPISGRLMAEYILDGRFLSVDVSMLNLARFEGQLNQEYNVV